MEKQAKFGLLHCFSLLPVPILHLTNKVCLGFYVIHDYFNSTMEVHSFIIIRRRSQRKTPSSDKHMNT